MTNKNKAEEIPLVL